MVGAEGVEVGSDLVVAAGEARNFLVGGAVVGADL